MSIERERRKWLIVAGVAFLVWAFVIAGIIALVEAGEVSAQATVSLLIAILVAVFGAYAGRALMRLSVPSGRAASLSGLVLYAFYLYIGLILVAGGVAWFINIPEPSTFPAYSMLKVVGAGTTILDIALLITFAMWHREYLQEIKSVNK